MPIKSKDQYLIDYTDKLSPIENALIGRHVQITEEANYGTMDGEGEVWNATGLEGTIVDFAKGGSPIVQVHRPFDGSLVTIVVHPVGFRFFE